MNGASALPMIWLAEWFSMMMTKMWSNAGTAGTAVAYAASERALAAVRQCGQPQANSDWWSWSVNASLGMRSGPRNIAPRAMRKWSWAAPEAA